MDNIDELMAKNAELLNSFNLALSKLNGEDMKQILPYLDDLNKITDMLNTGKHDEDFINDIKLKYAN
jgi:hypothetical protein